MKISEISTGDKGTGTANIAEVYGPYSKLKETLNFN